VGASEDASDLGIVALSSLDDYQPPYDDASIVVGIPAGDVENLWLQNTIHLNNIKTVAEFVRRL